LIILILIIFNYLLKLNLHFKRQLLNKQTLIQLNINQFYS